ncbi:MAG: PSD1 and planctomycete cytochrome C domain-containing protein [Verrucomicrobiales bacterium]
MNFNVTRSQQSLAAACLLVVGGTAAGAEKVDFNRDIRPILSNRCYACHGPDEEERKADLRLDTREGATRDLGGYAALVPGDPEASELLFRVSLGEGDDDAMPPKGKGTKLDAEEIELIRRWIEQDAAFARHWSYEKPVRPDVPKGKRSDWPRNEIDWFVLARLESEGLNPSPEADRASLARRLALDLTGLPPHPEEASAFLQDDSEDAYGRYVDALLAKSAFGERWARLWLDLARYADSAGYADDPPRTIWAYRDYVIQSLNENKPFDQFTIEQIAGDLLDQPDEEQLIATAFHRNTTTNSEGGTNDEEFRNAAVVDRVNTTMAVWMGTTMACAQCHTHKYDPFTHEEYFQLFAFFNQSEDADLKDESPVLELWSEEQKQQKSAWRSRIAELKKVVTTPTEETEAEQARWLARLKTSPQWNALVPAVADAKSADLAIEENGRIRLDGEKPATDVYSLEIAVPESGKELRALRLEIPAEQKSNFVLSRVAARWQSGDRTREIAFDGAVATYEQPGFPASAVLKTKKDPKAGWAIGGGTGELQQLTLLLREPLDPEPGKIILTLFQESNHKGHVLTHFSVAASSDENVREWARVPAGIANLIGGTGDEPKPEQSGQVDDFFLTIAPSLKEERAELSKLETALASAKPRTTVPVMRELPKEDRRKTFVQLRGNYQSLGAEVSEGVPAVFHSLDSEGRRDRLELARWLIDDENPLTARVIANRHWESIFGTGIVETSEEFGSQGELPSHPELLDWLAVDLREGNWDLKRFLKQLVVSATYRQSSKTTPGLQARDPYNRLLARGPRFRISAETIRDQALAASGLLSDKMHGPPARPPQPEMGLKAAFGGETDWKTSEGDDKYRRGLYTSWRRSNPYPSMATFDAPSREVCTVRRSRTNTPLQALVTLNDPVYVEAAQALGRKMATEGGDSVEKKIAFGLRRALVREPRNEEVSRLAELFRSTRNDYADRADDARSLAEVPLGPAPEGADMVDLAAWTVVSNVILNLDEMFLKR